ncbi:LAGLIDADG family homing endonuclease [Candidatus Kaiserbacteria bacterium]|nr:LAGLIDADG family homing endonuclease [Candidatus Kaiserbacteria bacterium]
MKDIYHHEPKYWTDRITGVSRISYFNVALASYLESKSQDLKNNILKLPIDLKREFIRAFFDDEGCMDFRPSRNLRQIRGYQKNMDILYLVQRLLGNFGIGADVKRPNEVVIRGKENLEKFQREINFSSGVRINGNRPNSIWKESLEKRELLERAIASYKPIGSNGVHRGG